MKFYLTLIKKPRVLLICLILLVIGAFFFNACKKNNSLTINAEDEYIAKAITWFNGKYSSRLEFDNKGEPKYGKYPDWRFAKSYSLDGYKILEAPLLEKYKTIFYKNKEEKEYLFANKAVTTINKFLIWGKNGKYRETIMTIVGDMKYLNKHRDLSDIGPNNIPKDFSGMIFYKRYDGKFQKGWFYENGKMTTKIKWYRNNINSSKTNDAANPPCTGCHPVTTYVSNQFGCIATTNYFSNLTDLPMPGIGPQVEEVNPSNCEGQGTGGNNPPNEDDEDPGDGGWGAEQGGLDDLTNPGGELSCYLYPNPFCDCYNGIYFNCEFGEDGVGVVLINEEEIINSVFVYNQLNALNAQISLYDYLKCFSNEPGATFKVTISADQPVPNSRKAYKMYGIVPDVGHTFLTIKETKADGTYIIRSLGFYPASQNVSPAIPSSDGAVIFDAGHIRDVSLTTEVNWTKVNQLIANIKASATQSYNLNSNNCSTWAIDRLAAIGIILPKTIGNWPGGAGCNPGDLGEDIRQLQLLSGQTKNLTTAKAYDNVGTCP